MPQAAAALIPLISYRLTPGASLRDMRNARKTICETRRFTVKSKHGMPSKPEFRITFEGPGGRHRPGQASLESYEVHSVLHTALPKV